MGTHGIKVKSPGEKIWYFLRSNGGETRLRIHAGLTTPEKAAIIAAEVEELNPGVKAKVVQIFG